MFAFGLVFMLDVCFRGFYCYFELILVCLIDLSLNDRFGMCLCVWGLAVYLRF